MTMELDNPVKLTSSLAKLLQYFCNGHVEFEGWAQVTGTLCLLTKNGQSVGFSVDEKVVRLNDDSIRICTSSFHISDGDGRADNKNSKIQTEKEAINENNLSIADSENNVSLADESQNKEDSSNTQSTATDVPIIPPKRPRGRPRIGPASITRAFNNDELSEFAMNPVRQGRRPRIGPASITRVFPRAMLTENEINQDGSDPAPDSHTLHMEVYPDQDQQAMPGPPSNDASGAGEFMRMSADNETLTFSQTSQEEETTQGASRDLGNKKKKHDGPCDKSVTGGDDCVHCVAASIKEEVPFIPTGLYPEQNSTAEEGSPLSRGVQLENDIAGEYLESSSQAYRASKGLFGGASSSVDGERRGFFTAKPNDSEAVRVLKRKFSLSNILGNKNAGKVQRRFDPTLMAKSYTCHFCGSAYKDKFALVEHIKKSHTAPVRTTGNDLKGKSPQMPKNKGKKEKDSKLQCDVCDKFFSSIDSLRNHMKRHDGSRPRFDCELCNISFLYPSLLALHKESKGHKAKASDK